MSLTLEAEGEALSPRLGSTRQSRYYLQQTEIPEISLRVERPATLITNVTF